MGGGGWAAGRRGCDSSAGGAGVYEHDSGDSYDGEWSDGQKHGRGEGPMFGRRSIL